MLSLLSPALHLGIIFVFIIGIVAAALPLRHFKLPSQQDAVRRLEKDRNLAHRPLTALADRPAGKKGDQTLWLKHQLQAAESLKSLSVVLPKSPVPEHDPYALRFAVIICLAITLVIGWQNPGERLNRTLFPGYGSESRASPPSIEAWITPPSYTGFAPIFLSLDHPPDPLTPPNVPQGSSIKVHLAQTDGSPALSIGPVALEIERVDGASFSAQGVIEGGDSLRIRTGTSPLLSWPITVIPDLPPIITLIAEPTVDPATQEVLLRYHAADDYAVHAVTLTLLLTESTQDAPLELSLSAPGGREGDLRFRRDLTDHPWAGREVEITLKAIDGAGQDSQTETVLFVLPERKFQHPVARRLAKARQRLIGRGLVRLDVASDLGIIAGRPEDFDHDSIVILGLSVAESRLIYNADKASLESVRALLWNMAIRLDKDSSLLARRELFDAEEALQEAMRQGADQETLERLIDQMADAMRRYLDEITADLNPETMPDVTMPEGMEAIGRDELNRLIEEARRLMRLGDKKGAQELMAQLKEMFENLTANKSKDLDKALAESKKILENLDRLEKEQRKRLDDTFARLNAPADTPKPTTDGAAEQEALRQDLNKLMDRFRAFSGESPESLNKADSAMDWARDSLERKRLDVARQHQSEALDQLRQARRDATKLLGQTLSQKGLQTFSKPGARGAGPDPFGRGRPGMRGRLDGKGPKLPGKPDLDRAGTILKELRRRFNDPTRRELERDYIERLLKMY